MKTPDQQTPIQPPSSENRAAEAKELWERTGGIRGAEQLLMQVTEGIQGGLLSPKSKEKMKVQLKTRHVMETIQHHFHVKQRKELTPEYEEELIQFRADLHSSLENIDLLLSKRINQVKEVSAVIESLIKNPNAPIDNVVVGKGELLEDIKNPVRAAEKLLLHVAEGITRGKLSSLEESERKTILEMRHTMEIIQWAVGAMRRGDVLEGEQLETLNDFKENFKSRVDKLVETLEKRRTQVQEVGSKIESYLDEEDK